MAVQPNTAAIAAQQVPAQITAAVLPFIGVAFVVVVLIGVVRIVLTLREKERKKNDRNLR